MVIAIVLVGVALAGLLLGWLSSRPRTAARLVDRYFEQYAYSIRFVAIAGPLLVIAVITAWLLGW